MITIKVPNDVDNIISGLTGAGYDAYAVGGCVRDSIIGETPNDWDICTSATTDEMKKYFEARGYKTIDTGIKHGTVTVLGEGGAIYEVTTFRVDGEYSDNRRPDSVKFVKNVEEDLSRRDFTVNAMAYNSNGLVDPFGGCDDLSAEIIRCVGEPDLRFGEDALRILRALRFASVYDFNIEEKTAEAIHRNKEKLKNISAERIREELFKLICGDAACRILSEYPDVMGEIIPELFASQVGYRTAINALPEYEGDDISIRFALLIGQINGGDGNAVCADIMDRLKFDTKTKNEVLELLENKDLEIEETMPCVLGLLRKLGEEGMRKLVLFLFAREKVVSSHCKAMGHFTRLSGLMWNAMIKNYCYTLKGLALSGDDLKNVGITDGIVIGKTLEHLLDMVIAEELQNEREALLEEAAKFAKK